VGGQSEFYGQRPWRPNRLDPVDLQREREGILALQYRERTLVPHSRLIIDLQVAALRQFALFGSPRTRTQAGLAIKNPPKKTHLKKPTKNGFFVFFKFFIFYENNTDGSL
jgi:hypothetical protein